MRFLRSSKCSKTTVELKFATQKSKRLQSLDCLFFFRMEIPFLGKFGPKTQNYQFRLKLDTQTNSNMQNSMVMFTSFVLYQKNPFLGKSCPENQNCQFRLKIGTRTNSNIRNSMMMFTFSVFDHKHHSCANLVQIFMIVCSK